MKNMKKTKGAQIGFALPVPVGTVGGKVVALGSDGLTAVAINDRATTALINEGKSAPGLKDGEATVELIGVHLVTEQTLPVCAQYDALFIDPDDQSITVTATDNAPAGFSLTTITGAPAKGLMAHK
jgi:hypothetical protein